MHFPKNRFIASATHFFISIIIFTLFVLLLLYLWFPAPYFSASGGWQGLKIAATVDLILGPLLTLVVFNIKKPKKELVRDLSIIATIQISALVWGMATIYQQRPLMITFWDGQFHTLSADVLKMAKISQKTLEPFGDNFPVYIYTKPPTGDTAKQKHLNKLFAGTSANLQPELYHPLAKHYDAVFEHNIDLNQSLENNPELKNQVDTLLEKSNTKLEENYYLPLNSFYGKFVLVFDKNNKRIGHLEYPLKNDDKVEQNKGMPAETPII